MRLIDAEELREARGKALDVYANADMFNVRAIRDGIGPLLDAIVDAPTIDPVKHGRWRGLHGDKMIACDTYRHYHYNLCSECGKGNAVKSNYCPNCGARMDRKGEGHD